MPDFNITQPQNTPSFEELVQNIISIDSQMQINAVKAINKAQTIRNWLIGAYIVEYEQFGKDRAKYGERLIETLVKRIASKGINTNLLRKSRQFYNYYPQIRDCLQEISIQPTVSVELQRMIGATSNSLLPTLSQIQPTVSCEFMTNGIKILSRLSFSHIAELLTIDDPMVRCFYETEAIKGIWSVRELRRQIATQLHIRIGLSKDKMKALLLSAQQAEQQTVALQIRDPYTFEFLGLKPTEVMSEENLKNALLNHLQEFLLEMGRGFCFEAREKRIIIDDQYYFADLVFYNRILHCSVILEVKVDEFKHEHIGQLNSYVSYYAENETNPGDNPPVGILICTKKGKKMVEYALGSLNQQLFVSTYQLTLPNKQELENIIKQNLKEI